MNSSYVVPLAYLRETCSDHAFDRKTFKRRNISYSAMRVIWRIEEHEDRGP